MYRTKVGGGLPISWLLSGACALAALSGCSSDEPGGKGDDADAAAGGEGGEGGSTGGKASSSGGATGGKSSTGGASSTGGTGGKGTGGASSTGGSKSSGGTSNTGGSGAGGDTGSPPTHPAGFTCTVTPTAPPAAAWKNVTANLAGMQSECGNLTILSADPCSNKVIAGVAKVGLYATTNGGGAWDKLGSGAGSKPIVHRPSSIVFDPEHPDVFWESGIYGSFADGIYKTTDGGKTFAQLGTIGHNDLVSVDFTDPERKTLLAGTHEQKQHLYLSKDGGATWEDIGKQLPADSHFSVDPLVLDKTHFLLGACGYGDGVCGVYASNDAGKTWARTSNDNPAGRPLWTADGHIIWTTIYDTGVIISADSGKTWADRVQGPRQAYPVEFPNGNVVALGGDHLIMSTDHGKTWANIGEPLPYKPQGVTYSTSTKTFYVWRWDCGNVVLNDAIMSAGYDYEK